MKRLSGIITLSACAVMLLAGTAASEGISIEGGLTHEKVASAGETYQGVIVIRNQTDSPQEVKVYQTDYWFNHEGQVSYGEPGKAARSNAPWISFSPVRVTVAPRDKSSVNYTIAVPAVDTLAGTYWSMLMIEGVPETSPETSGSPKEKKMSLGITHVMRYAIQVITHIGETGERKVSFLKTAVVKDQDRRILQVDVENSGQRLLRPQLWVELHTAQGESAGRFQGEQLRIYPQTSKRFNIDITAVPAGTYKALVVGDCGGNDLFGITYTLKLE